MSVNFRLMCPKCYFEKKNVLCGGKIYGCKLIVEDGLQCGTVLPNSEFKYCKECAYNTKCCSKCGDKIKPGNEYSLPTSNFVVTNNTLVTNDEKNKILQKIKDFTVEEYIINFSKIYN